MTTAEEFAALLAAPEGARLEFKEAKSRYEFDKLAAYCVALANEGGGKIVLGVTDRRPRRIVGTEAFHEVGNTESGLYERLHHRVPIEEHTSHGRRVLIVHVPPRLTGTAWSDRGTYWMRAGESLVPMADEQLRLIHLEIGPDYSGQSVTFDVRKTNLCPKPELLAESATPSMCSVTRQSFESLPALDGGMRRTLLVIARTAAASLSSRP